MTKEKTARLIPNAIQVCTDTEKVPSRLLLPHDPDSRKQRDTPTLFTRFSIFSPRSALGTAPT